MVERRAHLSLPRDPLRLALFLLTVITISRVHQHLGLDALRPALALAAVAVGYAFLNPRAISWRALGTWPARSILALGLAACLSVPFGISMGASARYLMDDFSRVLLFAFLLMLAARTARDVLCFVAAYVVACGLLVWMSVSVFEPSLASGSEVLRLGDMYSYDANDAGLVLVVGLPLCLLLMQSSGGALRAMGAVAFLGSGWAIALTGSRGAFLAMAAMGMAFLFLLDRVRLSLRIGALGALLASLLVAAPPGYWDQMGTLLEPRADYNWDAEVGRVAIARRGLGYLLDRPLFGLGIGNFCRAEGTLSTVAARAMPGTGVPWNAPHNSYLQAAAELGMAGGAAFFLLVFGGLVGMYRLRRRLPPSWEGGAPEERFLRLATGHLFLAYLGFAIASSFLSFAYLDPIYLLSALAAGVHVSVRRGLQAHTPHRVGGPGSPRGALVGVAPGSEGGWSRC